MTTNRVGISGISLYTPPYRVDLEAWCEWTGHPWQKIGQFVGRSFRMRGPEHNVYTMAATAVLRLIDQYDIDPQRVRFLGLGTESSTDNSAGAVIVKGMLDDALRRRGRPPIARGCEVPEFKHACLGGIYALKSAARYLATDGRGAQAIVVSADIAEYARGSSGEPTQGAGAVAMLIEENPKLAEIDLASAGSSSDYRSVDFRKPLNRFLGQQNRPNGQLQDLPVFNGKYSTTCYVDATLHSLEDMFQRRGIERARYFRELEAVFMHRPYQRMPQTGWAMGYLFALARGDEQDRAELLAYCESAGVDGETLLEEMNSAPLVRELVDRDALNEEVYPNSSEVLRVFRKTSDYRDLVPNKMTLGSELMMDLGNLYTAALPAWLAAGFEEAAGQDRALEGREILTIGYGSGDASEAIPLRVVEYWREAARRICFAEALESWVDLSREQYEALHDAGAAEELSYLPRDEFIVARVGERTDNRCTDTGIEYYHFVEAETDNAPRVVGMD